MKPAHLARRRRMGVAALAAAAALAVGAHATTASAAGMPAAASSGAVTNSNAAFGGNLPMERLEPKLHHKVTPVRVYFRLGQQFPSGQAGTAGLLRSGHELVVSLAVPGKGAYAGVAAGTHDTAIKAFLAQVEAAAVRNHLPAMYVCFQHEPDTKKHAPLGTPAQFVKAWDHVHALAAAAHLNASHGGRLQWVWILDQGGYRHGTAAAYWPGAAETNLVGVDGYNTGKPYKSGGTNQAATKRRNATPPTFVRTPTDIFGAAVAFAASHGNVPVFITEFGSLPFHIGDQTRPTWIRSMQAYVTAHPQIRATLYWDSGNFSVDTDPASIAGLATMAAHSR